MLKSANPHRWNLLLFFYVCDCLFSSVWSLSMSSPSSVTSAKCSFQSSTTFFLCIWYIFNCSISIIVCTVVSKSLWLMWRNSYSLMFEMHIKAIVGLRQEANTKKCFAGLSRPVVQSCTCCLGLVVSSKSLLISQDWDLCNSRAPGSIFVAIEPVCFNNSIP